jgi:hypothetical protein
VLRRSAIACWGTTLMHQRFGQEEGPAAGDISGSYVGQQRLELEGNQVKVRQHDHAKRHMSTAQCHDVDHFLGSLGHRASCMLVRVESWEDIQAAAERRVVPAAERTTFRDTL